MSETALQDLYTLEVIFRFLLWSDWQMRLVLRNVCKIWRVTATDTSKNKCRDESGWLFSCYAARKGFLSLLQWARSIGCEWDFHICALAAENGHLDLLQWARNNGCPWEVNTCYSAARKGHLEILKWARENGCDWDVDTCAEAAAGNHLKVLEWAVQNGCPGATDKYYQDMLC